MFFQCWHGDMKCLLTESGKWLCRADEWASA